MTALGFSLGRNSFWHRGWSVGGICEQGGKHCPELFLSFLKPPGTLEPFRESGAIVRGASDLLKMCTTY